MIHRRSTIPALLLALPLGVALTSCGFDYRTDQINTIGAGTNNREGTVRVLGARIVAVADGTGRLIGSLVNNSDEAASLQAVTSEDGSVTADFRPVRIPVGTNVNLAEDVEIPVSGDFAAGDVVGLTYEFDNGQTAILDVPVMKNCFQHADIEVSVPEEPAGSDATPGAEASEEHAEDGHATESGDPTYLCDHETPDAGGGH